MTRLRVLPSLEASGYRPHMLHAADRIWVERNCYVDVCIELLHALELEPLALMGACAAVDFEDDNFTFFKPSHHDIRALFGIEIEELNVWRPLLEHAVTHLSRGRFISTEADSFYLPDTGGTDYRRNHVKTTIILADLDPTAGHLGYFHNAGYHELGGDDFAGLFARGVTDGPTSLPLFAEIIRVDRKVMRPADELARLSRELLAEQVARRPSDNPIRAFLLAFEREIPSIQARGLAYYHAWAFATIRQIGSALELLSLHLRWLVSAGHGTGLAPAADDMAQASGAAKTFILKAARVVSARKPFDAAATLGTMADLWDQAMRVLVEVA